MLVTNHSGAERDDQVLIILQRYVVEQVWHWFAIVCPADSFWEDHRDVDTLKRKKRELLLLQGNDIPLYGTIIILKKDSIQFSWLGQFDESLAKFKQRLRAEGYPKTTIETSLSSINFASGPSALTLKKKANERILPHVTTHHPAVRNLKQSLLEQ